MQTKIPEEWTKFILKDVTFVNIMQTVTSTTC